MRFRQDVQLQGARAGFISLLWRPLGPDDTSKADWSQIGWRARETHGHGVLRLAVPNPRVCHGVSVTALYTKYTDA